MLFFTNNSIKHQSLVYTQLNDSTILFLTIQFSISRLATTSDQSGTGSDGNEGLLCIGGARGVMVIVEGNGHGDTSSNSRRDWLHFT